MTSNNIQEVQLNCFTSRVKPSEITWLFETPSNYSQFNDSELLDEASMTYRHYLEVNGTFDASTTAFCIYSVGEHVESVNYTLQGLIKITMFLKHYKILFYSSFRSTN